MKESAGMPLTANVNNTTKPVPHSDTGKRVRTLTTKAATCPNYLQDESDNDNSDPLPPTKENKKHANGNPKPMNTFRSTRRASMRDMQYLCRVVLGRQMIH